MNKRSTDIKPLEPIIKEVKKINKKQPEIMEKRKR
ncbi:MAG: hypothetical protein QG646_1374 [Euryarchaeota archaeon]|nr:hypothetical protein [Euryarchaeota archaeon]